MNAIPKYKDVISLIPYGLPQFLDFEVPFSSVRSINMPFMEVSDEGEVTADNVLQKNLTLHQLDKNEDGEFVIPGTNNIVEDTDYCIINSDKHLGPWLDKWIPIPFFRQSDDRHEDGSPVFQFGPTNWARAYLTRTANELDPEPANWRLVLCFDMQVDDSSENHCAINFSDISESAICSLAFQKRDNAQFLQSGWVREWLKSVWETYFNDKQKLKEMPKRRLDEDSTESAELHLAYLASYLVYLGILEKIIGNKKVRIAKVEEGFGDGGFINVDLVLDIGNSRTTGILVEHLPDDSSESTLLNSYRLQLRDMTCPQKIYSEPFETRVEFSKTEYGLSEYSDRSERENAFLWSSPVRTGPEAIRLAGLTVNSEGASGMSSPKRYLWDLDERDLWFYNKSQTLDTEELVSSLMLCRFVNNCGIPIVNIKELKAVADAIAAGTEKPKVSSIASDLQNIFGKEIKNQNPRFAMQPRFSRSSMMMFLFMELLQQALITINSPAIRDSRGYPDRPRRLSSLIFTVPPGMPSVERTIYNMWGKASVEIMWSVLGWDNFYQDYSRKFSKKDPKKPITDYRASPDVKCLWDEATCSQLVYVYNEIKHNYAYDAALFFETMGQKRSVPIENSPESGEREIKPTLRVASIDIGGGSSDISITTFIQANDSSSTNRIWPKQEITDGFSVGGDDVLQHIVNSLVLKGIFNSLVKLGVAQHNAEEAMRAMFGQKSIDVRIQNLRIQFIRQVAMPAAYALLSMYENEDLHNDTAEFSFDFRSLFIGEESKSKIPNFEKVPRPANEVIEFFRQEIMRRFGYDIDLMDLNLTVACTDVDKAINSILAPTLDNLGELVHAYNCDVLIVTGRPSCWHAIQRQIFEIVCIAPDRVIQMKNYKVGSWYRFANESGEISDPKTTVIMGAVLCQLAENALEGFVFNSSRLKLKDTARFVGELDNQGVLKKEKVWFDFSKNKYNPEGLEKIVDFSSPISIGYRQLETDRWTTTKCWTMDFATEEDRANSVGKTPYKVKVVFKTPDPNEGELDEKSIFREKLNQPSISDEDGAITERDGETPVRGRSPIKIKLSTLSKVEEKGCWMDTGVMFN